MGQSSSPGFPHLLLSARVPLPNKVSCFVSMCVSWDNSFLSVRQEPTFKPWKGSPPRSTSCSTGSLPGTQYTVLHRIVWTLPLGSLLASGRDGMAEAQNQ